MYVYVDPNYLLKSIFSRSQYVRQILCNKAYTQIQPIFFTKKFDITTL